MSSERTPFSNPRYPGGRLDAINLEIRVLWLLPGSDDDIVSCQVQVVSLMDDISPYIALSYVWGPTDNPKTIIVNDKTVAVTRYLGIALRYLRKPTEDRVLWIDAVCINQKDVPERNSQVAFMGDIYRSANRVLVWLGEADDESDLAFDLMPTVDINFADYGQVEAALGMEGGGDDSDGDSVFDFAEILDALPQVEGVIHPAVTASNAQT